MGDPSLSDLRLVAQAFGRADPACRFDVGRRVAHEGRANVQFGDHGTLLQAGAEQHRPRNVVRIEHRGPLARERRPRAMIHDRRVGLAGEDCRRTDALVAIRVVQKGHEVLHAGLGRTIGRAAEQVRVHDRQRRHGDHRALLLRNHVLQHGLCQVEHCGEIDVHRCVPLGFADEACVQHLAGAAGIIDVREADEIRMPDEFNCTQIPMSQFSAKISTIKNETVVLFCQTGKRSLLAAQMLFDTFGETKKIYSLQGGIINWLKNSPTQKT